MSVLRVILWAAAAGAAWLFRVFYNAWPGPWVFACVLALPPVLFLLGLPSMLGLGVRLEGPGRAVRGAEAEYSVHFTNARLLPIHAVTLRLALCNRYTGEETVETYTLRNLVPTRIRLPLPTEECGVVSCRVTRCELQDPLGLFSIRRRFDAEFSCAVLPEARKAPVNLDAALEKLQVLRPKYGGGFAEEYDLRAYRPGDQTNSIHWKLSSKADDLIVREALAAENSVVYLVLDHPGADDAGLSVLRGLSHALLAREEPHVLVADSLYPVGNEGETDAALAALLARPMGPPCAFDARTARCVFRICGSEVSVE